MLCQTETVNKGLEHCGAGLGTKASLSQSKVLKGGVEGGGKVETGGAKSLRAVQVN